MAVKEIFKGVWYLFAVPKDVLKFLWFRSCRYELIPEIQKKKKKSRIWPLAPPLWNNNVKVKTHKAPVTLEFSLLRLGRKRLRS